MAFRRTGDTTILPNHVQLFLHNDVDVSVIFKRKGKEDNFSTHYGQAASLEPLPHLIMND